MKFIEQIFSLRNEHAHKVLTVLGLKLKFKYSKEAYIWEHLYCILLHKFCKVKKNKVVFGNIANMKYSCNPKYLALELLSRNKKDLDLVWLSSKSTDVDLIPPEFRIVKYNSWQALYELASARAWISNSHFFLPFKKGLIKSKDTLFFQTFHGSMGIKKIDADTTTYDDLGWTQWQIKSSKAMDYLFTDSDFEANVFKSAFRGYGEIYKLGKPRDVVFYQPRKPFVEKVKSFYEIPSENNILLYAPTWRSDKRCCCYNIDIKLLKKSLKKRFGGEWSILIKSHTNMKKKIFSALYDSEEVINATNYPDMQELLAASDILISDYSSCLPEFIISRRPSFIYAADLEKYEDGFYYPLSTLPSPIAADNGELSDNILNFDYSEYKQKAENFLEFAGYSDDINSAKRIIDFILDKI